MLVDVSGNDNWAFGEGRRLEPLERAGDGGAKDERTIDASGRVDEVRLATFGEPEPRASRRERERQPVEIRSRPRSESLGRETSDADNAAASSTEGDVVPSDVDPVAAGSHRDGPEADPAFSLGIDSLGRPFATRRRK
jgi:hypothetical protein